MLTPPLDTNPAPAAPAAPAAPSPAPAARTQVLAPDAGVLTIWVPAEAKVYINGRETRSKGAQREYVSYGLKPGYSYRYQVRAEILRDGKLVEETRDLYLSGGAREAVAFGFEAKTTEGVAAL